ncbi:MAG: hypothetical protein HYT83_00565 [Candidatus Levybacteria bacterium]|nr:hypothetical protein [Candidatus Levybacteria bacterium]
MPTLHKVKEGIKTSLKFGVYSLIILSIFLVLINIGKNLKERFFPTPPPLPTVSFGKIPPNNFPKNATDKNLTYTLNTVSGTLPTFSDKAKVYKIFQPEPTLLSLKRAQESVGKISFTSQPIALSESIYQWTNNDNLSRKIIFNITSLNFNLSTNFLLTNQNLLTNKYLDGAGAKDKAQSFFSTMDSFPDDIDLAQTRTSLFAVENGELVPATSLSNATIVRVDFFQKDLDNIPIFYPNPSFSLIHALLTGSEPQGQIIEASFFHHNISNKTATYPIKTANEAFSQLKKGNAYIASYNGPSNEAVIKNVFLGYYLNDKEQDYLTPIIIFRGDYNFFAYVEAIKDDWIAK